jgi:YgiT-type zinc finger domain-containing protein
MFNFKCTECEGGTVQPQLRRDYTTKIRDSSFVVPDAYVGVCDHCEAEYFDPGELRRWKDLYEKRLEETGLYLRPSEVSEIVCDLGLSISDFARFLGTTRPSVNSWRNPDRKTPPLRSADLLLRLVRESMRLGAVDVVEFLVCQSGIEVQEKTTDATRRRCRTNRRAPRPSREEFDRLFGVSGPPRDVPSLATVSVEIGV